MSASLVGSEMCIRDRLCICSPVCFSQGSREPRRWRRESWPVGRPAPSPVSYTHLTLPTICSV
eukprot:9502132-Alexandrium_andersonii.AAC.1